MAIKIFGSDEIWPHDIQNSDPKASFDEIYTKSCPREYFRVLYGVDYIIPDLASGIFRQAVKVLEKLRGRPLKVLDVGCSYGVNAILLRLPLDFHRLAKRYADLSGFALSAKELADLDRHYLASWPREDIEIIGLDASAAALSYARSIGAIDDGIALNLENDKLTAKAAKMLEGVDLIISTGCIGYVTERTFRQILNAIPGQKPWIASFVLRMYAFDGIRAECEHNGLATEKLEGITFVQRRFHSENEYIGVIDALESSGITTDGKEAEGLLHAEFWLSRPPEDIGVVPLADVCSVTTGARHAFGRRYQRRPDKKVILLKR